MQELRFLGAVGTVTGSKLLVATNGGKVLVEGSVTTPSDVDRPLPDRALDLTIERS